MEQLLPTQDILDAFQIEGDLLLLSGGRGTTVKVGDTILKQVRDEKEYVWIAETMNSLKQDGFRLPMHLKTKNGQWIYKGWGASTYIEGQEIKGRWEEKVKVSRAFHKALSILLRPDFIGKGVHPWVIADKVAFGELPFEYHEAFEPVLSQLRAIIKPIDLPNQLIHGDMPGNILFHNDDIPVVIDFSLYWRPAEFATAIILVDGIVWEEAPDSIIDLMENTKDMNQLLVRAEIRRIMELYGLYKQFGQVDRLKEVNAHTHVIDLIVHRTKVTN